MAAAPAPAQFAGADGYDFDASLAQLGVGVGVTVVADDHAWFDGHDVVAVIPLFAFGGEVIASFTFAMIWGIVVGTYSSIFIAAPLLISLNLRPGRAGGGKDGDADDDEAEKAAPSAA